MLNFLRFQVKGYFVMALIFFWANAAEKLNKVCESVKISTRVFY